jgi:hypothetical protein
VSKRLFISPVELWNDEIVGFREQDNPTSLFKRMVIGGLEFKPINIPWIFW